MRQALVHQTIVSLLQQQNPHIFMHQAVGHKTIVILWTVQHMIAFFAPSLRA